MEKIKKWPKDWTSHLIKTFKLYFSNKKIKYIKANSFYSLVTDATPENLEGFKYTLDTLHIDLEINGVIYQAYLTFPKPKIICSIYVLEDTKSKKEFNINYAGAIFDYSVMWNIAGFDNSDRFETVKLTETIIISDYKTRFNDDDNDEGNNEEPVEPLPTVPSNSVPVLLFT
jgi:hypothetical protein